VDEVRNHHARGGAAVYLDPRSSTSSKKLNWLPPSRLL